MAKDPRPHVGNDNNSPLWKDIIMVSRPGWWLVSVWLYLAPTNVEIMLQSRYDERILLFVLGFLYVCGPLNLLTYGLNDYADAKMDLSNHRKGNYMFGSKGLDKSRLRLIVKIAVVATVLPLPWFVASCACSTRETITNHQEETPTLLSFLGGQANRSILDEATNHDFTLFYALILGVWYLLGVLMNVSYNFSVLGHVSCNGPWETPLVYVGFGLVTAFSYWINVLPQRLFHSNDSTTFYTVWGTSTTGSENACFRLFGCNTLYWIHLAFLISTTQLWTEYMDYHVDRWHGKQTTLTKFCHSHHSARRFILWVMLCQVLWTLYMTIYISTDWKLICAFSVASTLVFVASNNNHEPGKMQQEHEGTSESEESSLDVDSSSWLVVAMGQNLGGLLLLYHVWTKGLFEQS